MVLSCEVCHSTRNLPFLAEPELPATGHYTLPSTVAWSERVRQLDGLILALPEYNAGYPAVVKNAFDSLHAEWNDLPAGIIGYRWGAAANSVKQFGEVLDRVQCIRLERPVLKFGEDLTPEG